MKVSFTLAHSPSFTVGTRSSPQHSPCLTKVPLAKWDESSRYLAVNHFVSPKRLPPESGAVLHFKFLGDFISRAVREAARGEYFDGASEYKRYMTGLEEESSANSDV